MNNTNNMNNMNNMDINKLMGMISKMDKKELQDGLAKVSKILNSNDKDEILRKLNQK